MARSNKPPGRDAIQLKRKAGGNMKRQFLGVLTAALLAGTAGYGQTLMKATGSDGSLTRAAKERPALSFLQGQGVRPGVPVLRGGADPHSVYPVGDLAGLQAGWNNTGGDRRHDRYFDHGHGNQTVVFINAAPLYVAGYSGGAPTVDQVQDAYYQPGYQWGLSLSQYSVTWDQLLDYLGAYIVNAPPAAQDAFRAGFIDGFGGSGPATFDHAMQVASQ